MTVDPKDDPLRFLFDFMLLAEAKASCNLDGQTFSEADFADCQRCKARFFKDDGSCTEGGNVCRDCVQKEASFYFDEWQKEQDSKDEARDLSGPRNRENE